MVDTAAVELCTKPCLRCFPYATWLEHLENSSDCHHATFACATAQNRHPKLREHTSKRFIVTFFCFPDILLFCSVMLLSFPTLSEMPVQLQSVFHSR